MVEPFGRSNVSTITGISIDQYDQLLTMLSDPDKKIVFIHNLDSWKEKARNDVQAIANFLLLTNRIQGDGNGLILIREYANSTGLADMGVDPYHLPGRVTVKETAEQKRIATEWKTNLDLFKATDLKQKMLDGGIKAVLLFGEDPLALAENQRYFDHVEFVMLSDAFRTHSAAEADVILPAATFMEQDGTYTTCDRRVQSVKRITKPATGWTNWRLIAELGKQFSDAFNYDDMDALAGEITRVNRLYTDSGAPFNLNGHTPEFAIFQTQVSTVNPEKPTILYSEQFYRSRIKTILKL